MSVAKGLHKDRKKKLVRELMDERVERTVNKARSSNTPSFEKRRGKRE